MATKILTITYTGTVLGQGTVNPTSWDIYGASYDRGFPAFKPQLELEVLQPFGVDGARYRVGGLHFPPFTMTAVFPSVNYFIAGQDARNIEQIKGDTISIRYVQDDNTTYNFYVLDCRAVPNARRIIGANAVSQGTLPGTPGGNPVTSASGASVDVVLSLQGYVP